MTLNTEKIILDISQGIGWLTFNNPEKRNAISLEMWQGIADAMEIFGKDDSVKLVVMQGAGDLAFAAGADISEFKDKRSNVAQKEEYNRISSQATVSMGEFSKPLIALIQGYCIGGGLAIALQADIRIASDDSVFSIPAARLGLGYPFAGLKLLAALVGPSHAKDIMFTARKLNTEEAMRIGLINFSYPRDQLKNKISAYVQKIAENAPLTIKAAKLGINEAVRDSSQEDPENIKQLVNTCIESEDYKEGRTAFMEKRAPQFQGQ